MTTIAERGAPTETRVALKEWAIACDALGRGQQILLLRKGGIREEHREFRVEHPDFLLFPTYEHQRADLVKPFARPALRDMLATRASEPTVEFSYWARVADVFEVSEPEQLSAVAPFHLWSEEYAEERLRWRPRKPLQLIALRIFRLPEPTVLPLSPEYGGCRSWLTLDKPVAVGDAVPVLDDVRFAEQLERVRDAIQRVSRPGGRG